MSEPINRRGLFRRLLAALLGGLAGTRAAAAPPSAPPAPPSPNADGAEGVEGGLVNAFVYDAGISNPLVVTEFYDNAGRLTDISGPGAVVTFVYDARWTS
jgi:hypothetical protein